MKRILLTLALVVLLALAVGAAALAAGGSDEPADDPLIGDLRPQLGGGGNADQVQ